LLFGLRHRDGVIGFFFVSGLQGIVVPENPEQVGTTCDDVFAFG
jgi:hypothetical protein